jgi:hypothetical protein
MPKSIITRLTEEQEALISIYRDKWRSIQLLTEPIELEQATATVKAAYIASNYPEPEILFYNSPLAAIEKVLTIENFRAYLGRHLQVKFSKRVLNHLEYGIREQIDEQIFVKLRSKIQFPEFPHYPTDNYPQNSYFLYGVTRCTEHQLIADLDKPEFEFADISYLANSITLPPEWAILGCMFDFCISVLNVRHDKKKWKVLQDLMQYCSFLFLFEKVCILCDRPVKLSFNRENMLQAEREPALQFTDGYSVYADREIHHFQKEQYDEK